MAAEERVPDISMMSLEEEDDDENVSDGSDQDGDDEDDTEDVETSEGARITDHLLRQLRDTISQEHGKATFVCGGVVPIVDNKSLSDIASDTSDLNPCACPPITIRWDPSGRGEGVLAKETKLTFPLADGAERNLERLIRDCQPATSGKGGEGVYDEGYRKALQMNPEAFSVNFNPYDLGIIDTIAQVLLPSIIDSRKCRAVRAELYKLNIYSGPQGKFRAHVDAPRFNMHFGTLVICLPVEHEGGRFQVRHKEKEMTFDWGTARNDRDHASIRWTAFYSDCEHEVREVFSGHRVTLTYNLYATRGNGVMAGNSPTMDPAHLPLCQFIETMLGVDKFMTQGGYLGFFCAHAYGHTNVEQAMLPHALKGLDMVVWETFTALGLFAEIRPVAFVGPGRSAAIVGNSFPLLVSDEEVDDEGDEGVEEKLKFLQEDWIKEDTDMTNVSFDRITWLTRPSNKELQAVYIAQGDEASTGTIYSFCAIVVKVPSYGRRAGEKESDEESD